MRLAKHNKQQKLPVLTTLFTLHRPTNGCTLSVPTVLSLQTASHRSCTINSTQLLTTGYCTVAPLGSLASIAQLSLRKTLFFRLYFVLLHFQAAWHRKQRTVSQHMPEKLVLQLDTEPTPQCICIGIL